MAIQIGAKGMGFRMIVSSSSLFMLERLLTKDRVSIRATKKTSFVASGQKSFSTSRSTATTKKAQRNCTQT